MALRCMIICESNNLFIVQNIEDVLELRFSPDDKLPFPTNEEEMSALEVKLKEFLGRTSFTRQVLLFLGRLKERIRGDEVRFENLIIVEAPTGKNESVKAWLPRISKTIARNSNHRVMTILASSDASVWRQVHSYLQQWDAVLPSSSEKMKPEEMAVPWLSAIQGFRRGFESREREALARGTWRMIDLVFIGLLLPLIVGACSGFGEGVGQRIYEQFFIESSGEGTIEIEPGGERGRPGFN